MFALKECNIGGGVVISNNHPRMEVPSDFFSSTSEEKWWRTGRWSPEGDGGVEEEKLLFLSKRFILNFWSQCLVGCFSPVWEHPPTYDREQDF